MDYYKVFESPEKQKSIQQNTISKSLWHGLGKKLRIPKKEEA